MTEDIWGSYNSRKRTGRLLAYGSCPEFAKESICRAYFVIHKPKCYNDVIALAELKGEIAEIVDVCIGFKEYVASFVMISTATISSTVESFPGETANCGKKKSLEYLDSHLLEWARSYASDYRRQEEKCRQPKQFPLVPVQQYQDEHLESLLTTIAKDLGSYGIESRHAHELTGALMYIFSATCLQKSIEEFCAYAQYHPNNDGNKQKVILYYSQMIICAVREKFAEAADLRAKIDKEIGIIKIRNAKRNTAK